MGIGLEVPVCYPSGQVEQADGYLGPEFRRERSGLETEMNAEDSRGGTGPQTRTPLDRGWTGDAKQQQCMETEMGFSGEDLSPDARAGALGEVGRPLSDAGETQLSPALKPSAGLANEGPAGRLSAVRVDCKDLGKESAVGRWLWGPGAQWAHAGLPPVEEEWQEKPRRMALGPSPSRL